MDIIRINSLAEFSADQYNRIPISDAQGLIRLLCFGPGQSVRLHDHPAADEYFYLIEGNGRVTIGSEEEDVEQGYMVKVPAGVHHQWKSGSRKLLLLSILLPSRSYEFSDEATKTTFV